MLKRETGGLRVRSAGFVNRVAGADRRLAKYRYPFGSLGHDWTKKTRPLTSGAKRRNRAGAKSPATMPVAPHFFGSGERASSINPPPLAPPSKASVHPGVGTGQEP